MSKYEKHETVTLVVEEYSKVTCHLCKDNLIKGRVTEGTDDMPVDSIVLYCYKC